MTPGVLFTTLHFPCNLPVDPISWSVCAWEAFPVMCNQALYLIGAICKLQRKCIVVKMAPGVVFYNTLFPS
jgi:hypothetical protein